MIKKLFYYCYYRISRGYRFWGDSSYLDWGYWILIASFIFIAWSIAAPLFYIFDIEYTKIAIFLVALPFILLEIWVTFFLSDESKNRKYKELEERYRNEKYKNIKGWLIALYVFGTLLLAVLMRILFSS